MPRVIVCPMEPCRKSIRLPDQVRAEASLRCPFCQSVFKLASVTPNAPVFSRAAEEIKNGSPTPPLPETPLPAPTPASGTPPAETVSRLEQQTSDPLQIPPIDQPETPRGTVSFVPQSSDDEENAALFSARHLPASTQIAGQVGRFRLRRILGEGAFGKVYEAYDPQLDRTVALKVAKLDRGDAGQRLKRFLREAKAAANLRHPHIVPLYEFGEVGDQFYLTLAYIEGVTLADSIRAQKDAPQKDFRQTATIVMHLAEALAYAHGQAIVHRDIKPANVMLDAKGDPLLMDFGLATWPQDEKLTVEGSVMGTPAYMAPEQCRGETSPASDQYSLGVTLYQLLTGQTPFQGPIDRQMFHHLNTEPPPPRKLNRFIPGDLETICLKCLEKEPTRRYADCQSLADDLQRWLKGEPTQARPVGPVEKLGKWARRNPIVASLAALLVTVSIAGFGAVVYQLDQTSSALSLASKNATDFENASILAKTNENEAVIAFQVAEKERVRAKHETAEATRSLYVANVGLASQSLEAGHFEAARDLLQAVIPASGDEDLRGFEWHYLWRQCNLDCEFLANPKGHVRSVAISPDGKTLIAAGGLDSQGELAIWDFKARKIIGNLRGFKSVVNAAVFSPDGAFLATAEGVLGIPGEIKIWNLADQTVVSSIGKGTDAITSLAFTPDGKKLISGAAIFTKGTGGPGDRYFNVTSGTRQGSVKLWNIDSGKETATFPGDTGHVFAVACSPDGSIVAAGNAAGTVMLWQIDSLELIDTVQGIIPYVWSLAFSPNGEMLAGGLGFANGRGEAKIWALPQGKRKTLSEIGVFRGHHGGVPALAFSRDGKTLAIGGWDRIIRVFDLSTLLEIATISGHSGYVWTLAFSSDGRTLVSGSWHGHYRDSILGEVRSWDLSKVQQFVVTPYPSQLGHYKFAQHGQCVAVQKEDNTIVVEKKGALPVTLKGGLDGSGGVRSLAFSPDGTKIAAGGSSYSARLWDSESGAVLAEFKTGSVPYLVFSPDGRQLATAGDDGVARLWCIKTGLELFALRGHTDIVWDLAFTPDSRRLATCSWDRTIKLWDTSRGSLMATLKGHGGTILRTRFINGGKTLVSGATIHIAIWDGTAPGTFNFTGPELLDQTNREGYFLAGIAFLALDRIHESVKSYEIAKHLESMVDINVPYYPGRGMKRYSETLLPYLHNRLAYSGKETEILAIVDKLVDSDPKEPRSNKCCKVFSVPLSAGQGYVIDLKSKQFDTYVRVGDSNGKTIAEDDDGGDGTNSSIRGVITSTDTYRIYVSSFGGTLGEFSLTVRVAEPRPGMSEILGKIEKRISDR